MSEAKTKSTAAAAKSKAAAARSEKKKDESRTVKFRDIDLVLPKTLPATVAFDMAAVESGNVGATAIIRLVGSMIGDDQLTLVRNKIASDGDQVDKLDVILTGLVESVFAAYGMTAGESSASAES